MLSLKNEILTYEFLYDCYINKEMSTQDIYEKIGKVLCKETIRLQLVKYNIKRRSIKESTNTENAKLKLKTILNSDIVRQKSRQTSIRNYGTINPSCSDIIKEKKKETCLKHFGTTSPFGDKTIYNKAIDTWVEKYGVTNPNKSKLVRDKTKATCLDKYGYVASFMHPDIKRKCIESLNINGERGSSKISVDFFKNVSDRFPNSISSKFKYSNHGDELIIKDFNNNTCYYLDFSYVNKDIKFAIEFNGNYFHMNPTMYSENDPAPFCKDGTRTAKDIWDFDDHRKQVIESQGFKVLTVWEYDYLHDKENTINKCVNFINECLDRT